MPISSQYIPAFTIEEVILDKDTGLPLSGGVVTFYRDAQRDQMKPVFQITGTSQNYSFAELPNPMTLSSIGTFEDSMGNSIVPYFYPWITEDDNEVIEDLYYVVVESEGLVQQFVREAVPYIPQSGVNPDQDRLSYENQVSNPGFVETLFYPATSRAFSVTGSGTVTNVAPGWSIVTTGTGTVTLEQVSSIATNATTNPPYALRITSSGVTGTVNLRQRFDNSPRLFANGSVSGSFVVSAAAEVTLTLKYIPSDGDEHTIKQGTSTNDGTYTTISGTVQIGGDINTDPATTGYFDLVLEIPVSTTVTVSNFQLVETTDLNIVTYNETSSDRQVDQLFHYYKPQLDFKPIASYLTGWDFPLNPSQFLAKAQAASGGANTSRYIWDQTIMFQSAASGITVYTDQNTSLGLQAASTSQTAIIQYLSGVEARELLNQKLSVMVSAYASLNTTATISLWYTTNASLPNLNVGTSVVSSLSSVGKPTVAVGWTEVPRSNLGDATFTIQTAGTNYFNNYGFTGWALDGAAANSATFFAIVVGTQSISTGLAVAFNSISLVPGEVPTIPAVLTPNQTLQNCQYYYEKSYAPGVVPGTVDNNSYRVALQSVSSTGANATFYATSFGFNFLSPKVNVLPTVTLYSPVAVTAGNVNARLIINYVVSGASANVATTNWTVSSSGPASIAYRAVANVGGPSVVTASLTNEGTILYHYTVDARLGIV